MEAIRLVIVLVLCFWTVFCFPSRPLNERSPELAWQAWLLVDDQNQNKQNEDGVLKRRITPKSVFIAPTFSPESLPPCADGYASDPMGRCIKIIKLDEDAHLEFLLQKLNDKFGDTSYEEEEEEEIIEEIATQGPFQVNIPLGGDSQSVASEEGDIAIVVAPTRSNFAEDKVEIKTEPVTVTESTTEVTETTTEIETTTLEASTAQESTTQDADHDLNGTESTTELNEGTSEPTEQTTEMTTTTTTSGRIKFPEEGRVDLLDLNTGEVLPEPQRAQGQYARDTLNQYQYQQYQVTERDRLPFLKDSVETTTRFPQELNHRNRDKHNNLFLLPPRWSHSSLQKPLVLRFSRKRSYMDARHLSHPDFYRSVPSGELSSLFGVRPSSHR